MPCPACNSSDAVAEYKDGGTFCHKCQTPFSKEQYVAATGITTSGSTSASEFISGIKTVSNLKIPEEYEFSSDKVRAIPADVLRKYGVRLNQAGDFLFNIRDQSSSLSGYKTCLKTLNEKGKKTIRAMGTQEEAMLFGQHLFAQGGKRLVITEGEIDATSSYFMLGERYPVVSVVNGVGTALKDIRRNIGYVESFTEVILCFDNDKPGQTAAKEIAKILTPGKAKIVPLSKYNDPNDYLTHGAYKDFVSSFWEAKRFQPDGIINLADIFELVMKEDEKVSIPYPWQGLNDMLDGIRSAELVTITSGTGMGKSSVMRELEYHLLVTTQDTVGILALEETPVRTTQGIMGVHCNTQLHRKKFRDEIDPKVYKEAFLATAGTGRLVAYDHFGSTSGDNLIAQIRYMIKALNCKHIILDHLSIVVSSQEDGGDERKNIDSIMTKLRSLVQETGVSMFLVSHLRRVSGDKGHENGAEVSLSHLRGSQAIAQLSDAVIALERNQQAATDKEANLTKVRIVKSRYTGQTGIATHLYFDSTTGRLIEIGDEEAVKLFLSPDPNEVEF